MRSFSNDQPETRSLDITGARLVEIKIRPDGKVLWINVDGSLALRVCRIEAMVLDTGDTVRPVRPALPEDNLRLIRAI
jgi:hypothetical protein